MNVEEKLNGREVREIYRVGFGGLGFDGWGSMPVLVFNAKNRFILQQYSDMILAKVRLRCAG